jgi:hypothetical protein
MLKRKRIGNICYLSFLTCPLFTERTSQHMSSTLVFNACWCYTLSGFQDWLGVQRGQKPPFWERLNGQVRTVGKRQSMQCRVLR